MYTSLVADLEGVGGGGGQGWEEITKEEEEKKLWGKRRRIWGSEQGLGGMWYKDRSKVMTCYVFEMQRKVGRENKGQYLRVRKAARIVP